MSRRLSALVLDLARQRNQRIALAESCTGGMAAAELTAIAGASDAFDRGFVTYSNAAKVELLGVSEATLAAHGAVSSATAREMAEGALARSRADLAVAVTGIAGPGGGSPDKPVGLVWFAVAARGHATHAMHRQFSGFTRDIVRRTATETVLRLLAAALGRGHVDAGEA